MGTIRLIGFYRYGPAVLIKQTRSQLSFSFFSASFKQKLRIYSLLELWCVNLDKNKLDVNKQVLALF